MADNTGITTSTLAGKRDEDLAQDHLAEKQGYNGLPNCQVEHVSPGREVTRSLPKGLEVSPLSMPPKRAAKPASPSQKPGRPGRVPTR